ncbi:MAG: hypothetical protein Q7S98_02555 [Deltaproteobacteria bacterium]|nr:hypothetical protein [Deltaproteobacteria bacterium]
MKPVSKKIMQAFKEWGEAGGKKRAKNLSSSARQAISRHAAEIRWGLQKAPESPMSSVRLNEAVWENPVYLEEILSYGSLRDWKELRRRIADRPFGAEADALEKVLQATNIYGTTSLWKAILGRFQGGFL